MSDCFVLYLLLTCMKKKTSGADKFTNNTQSIIPTAPDGMRKKNMRSEEQVRPRLVIALSLPAFGQMPITV